MCIGNGDVSTSSYEWKQVDISKESYKKKLVDAKCGL